MERLVLTDKLSHFFENIGAEWVLWLLLALLGLSIIIVVERLLFFWRNRVDTADLSRRVIEAIRAGQPRQAREQLGKASGMAPGVLGAALDAWDDGVDSVEEVIAAAVARERTLYDKWLSVLGTLGNSAPFIGLFGTVIGILSAFSALGTGLEGAELKTEVMGAIGEALVATAVGLGVAIPCVIAFNAFKNRIRIMSAETENIARLLMAHLKAHSKGKS
jgi:biopolymer transport protein ExbB